MAQLRLTLLGTFAASWAGRPVVAFPTDKVRALLAYLALEGERPLRRETLATLLWPDYPDDIARRNLRQNLHRLNQLLDALEPGLSDRLLLVDRQTVRLNCAHVRLDVAEFEGGLTAVETHPHRRLSACQPCLDTLANAARLVRGDLLAGFTLPDAPLFDEWLIIRRERLHYQSLQLLHTLAEVSLERGDFDPAYQYAARQIALEPWREEAHRQMMLALARQGWRSEALAQYATCARLLEEELGLPPSGETAALYQEILNETLPIAATSGQLHHFPATFTPFIGREAEIGQIVDQMQDPACRLLTLIAPGGMGKTRLSIAAAAQLANAPQFADGLYFVPLAATNDRDALLIALAQAVEMPLQGVDDVAAALGTFLKGKRLLLVLDNFEQLVAEAAVVVGLLTAVPHLQLLITSREPLNLQAEWQIRLDGLPYAPEGAANWADCSAAQLFIQTASRVRPGFAPARYEAAISRICQLVGGMPLALEMAAAWSRLMEPEQIANQISDSLDFLVATARDVPERQRSIYAVLNQSWNLLEPDAQQTLAQLGLFQAGFSLEAAVFVSGATLSGLSALANKALLRPGLAGRYELHPLLRQFALEQLTTFGPPFGADCRQRHAAYFLQRLAAAETDFHQANAAAVLSEIQPDLDNVRLAWGWAAGRQDAPLLAASQRGLARFFRLMGLHQEGAALLAQGSARLAGREEWKTAVALLQFREATLRLELGSFEAAKTLLHSARATWETAGDAANLSRALADLGIVAWRMGDLDAAEAHLQESLALAQQVDDGGQIGYALHHLGNIAWFRSDYATAVLQVSASLPYYRQQGDLRRLAAVLSDLGAAQMLQQGDHDQSRAYFSESLALYRQLGDRLGTTYPLHNLGYLALMTQEYESAEQLFGETLRIGEQMGDQRSMANTLHHLGLTTLLGSGDLGQAAAYFRDGLRLANAIQEWQVMGDALMGLAVTAVRQGDFATAVRLAGGMQARLGEFRLGGLVESPLYEAALAEARAALGEAAFAALWAEGAKWSLADVVTEGAGRGGEGE
jgi:DNA-binding SARP family transcriptional activator/predicted ATPase